MTGLSGGGGADEKRLCLFVFPQQRLLAFGKRRHEFLGDQPS